jgi:hypothetical protein
MSSPIHLYHDISELTPVLPAFREKLFDTVPPSVKGICGFDGFVDTFIRMKNPASMESFGAKVSAAAGVAASYSVDHQGDKFGGNGPLLTCALDRMFDGNIGITYIGGIGKGEVDPLFADAMGAHTEAMYTLAPPAHSDCLEFTDGKIMLGDFDACNEITLERLLEVVGEDVLNQLLREARFISAVNWGKLPHVGEIWSDLAKRLQTLGRPPKEVPFFMDLAEFEHRSSEDVHEMIGRLGAITQQCTTLLSFNLKEAWQMGDVFGGSFHGKKDPKSSAELAGLLFENLDVDKVIIHPNDGAACASSAGVVYVPGPFCQQPLISTGAGDNFGAGCLAATLLGLEDAGIVLTGNAASGHYVRSGKSPTFNEMVKLVDAWSAGSLPERL